MTSFAADPRVLEYRRVAEEGVPMSVRQAAEIGFVHYMLESSPDHMHQTVLRVLAREGFMRESLRLAASLTPEDLAALPAPDGAEDKTAALRAMPYAEYLKTDHWHFTRQAALSRAHNRCQVCNTPSSEVALEVHHRTYEHRGQERPEDLIVLCDGCHSLFHERRGLAA